MAAAASSTKTVPGRPFPPGVSGNPSGRPKLPDELKQQIAELGAQGLARIGQLSKHKDPAIALRASEYLADRWLGKATQRVEFALEDARETARRIAREQGTDEELAVAEAEAIFRGERYQP